MVWALVVMGFSEEEALYMRKRLRGGENELQDVRQGQDPVLTAMMILGTFPSLEKT